MSYIFSIFCNSALACTSWGMLGFLFSWTLLVFSIPVSSGRLVSYYRRVCYLSVPRKLGRDCLSFIRTDSPLPNVWSDLHRVSIMHCVVAVKEGRGLLRLTCRFQKDSPEMGSAVG